MLLNLSNHSYKLWNRKQLESAKSNYGKIKDIEFPQINPHANKNEISLLAKKYAEKCIKILKNKKIKAVHIMGEMTFCYKVVSILQKHGITCIASTSERNVFFSSSNNKQSRFDFVRFREYPAL